MIKAATKPKVSSDEKEYRNSKFADYKEIVNKKNLLCTSCNVSVRPFVLRGKVKAHPFLDTLLCDKCYSFYGDGNFSVDEEDGSDKYCRWCGQGGTLYLCSTCTGGFCKKCIKRNLPRSELKSVESDDWSCFCCDVKPLYELRALCWAASTYVQENTTQEDSEKKRKKRKASVSSESDNENDKDSDAHTASESEKKSPKKKATKSSKSPGDKRMEMKKIRALLTKMTSVTQDAIKMCDLSKGKLTELKSKKLTTRFVKDEDTALSVSTKLISSLSSIENLTGKFRTIIEDYVKQWSALNVKEETNGDVSDKKDEEEKEERKQKKKDDSKDDSEDSSSSSKKKASKQEEDKQTAEKSDDDDDGEKSDKNEKTKQSDSDDEPASKKKKSLRRSPSAEPKDGKRKKSKKEKDTKESDDETRKDGEKSDEEEKSKLSDSDDQPSTKKKKSLRRTPSTESKDDKRRKSTKEKDADVTSSKSAKRKHTRGSSSIDSIENETPKRKRSKKSYKVDDSNSDDDVASTKGADETKSDDGKVLSENTDNDD